MKTKKQLRNERRMSLEKRRDQTHSVNFPGRVTRPDRDMFVEMASSFSDHHNHEVISEKSLPIEMVPISGITDKLDEKEIKGIVWNVGYKPRKNPSKGPMAGKCLRESMGGRSQGMKFNGKSRGISSPGVSHVRVGSHK